MNIHTLLKAANKTDEIKVGDYWVISDEEMHSVFKTNWFESIFLYDFAHYYNTYMVTDWRAFYGDTEEDK